MTNAREKLINELGETMNECDCGLDVCPPWHTDENYKGCTFPDCGCDGARLCMVGDPSSAALTLNRDRKPSIV